MATNGNAVVDASPPAPKKSKVAIEQIYQKKTQLEHILLRPDTYIGSVEPVTEQMWVFEDDKLVQKSITYVPGLYKIFDEILVNAADNKQRDKHMDLIKIDIDQENNEISIWNNGTGIPIAEHKDEKMFVPTMIFGHLLTSSNFNDDEKKVTGGRNGYGAKLCNVFSKKFTVETAHKKSKKRFRQTWEKNMLKAGEPKIKEFTGEDFTKITFSPDLAKFKMTSLDNDIVALFSRRAYDVAASTRGVKVQLNGKRVPVKNFKDYVDLFLKERQDDAGNPLKFTYESASDRWEIAVAASENGFQQISFVNSIATTKGGRHVDYVADMVVKNLAETIKKKNKNGIDIKPFQVRNHLWIFINCLIENPTFDSQTKENMTLQSRLFGSKCQLSEKFYTQVVKSGIVENVLSWAKFKAESLLNKTSAGRKQNKVKGLPKLEDANDAGTKNSLDCTLLLTEGDSAKTIVVAGLGVVGRDKYGVFPLRGKLLNVREASTKQIMENAEINALVKILGLQYKRKYKSIEDMKTLRYGRLMIMTDQDHDGSHIKGLIINFIHHNWPDLLKMNFMEEFITPIVKANKKDTSHSFFSLPEFEEWKKETPNWKTYHIKYYKGLGTSTAKEAKEYFTDIGRHRIKFRYEGQKDDDNITMAFSKKCVDQRKDWLTSWMENTKQRAEMGIAEDIIYSKNVRSLSYSDFINKELVLFSNLDNERSIPSLVDGLKPGQRKVLFTCFKRNDKREVKVAQLAGSVGEQSAYHHGEASLMSTIINLAQNYVGSNNINLLQPIGQFGTRLMGGKDAASPRYIFTKLSPLARAIFCIHDDPILKPQFDDNQKIEPEWYCPIIPMVLVNGADGIGTGWMTKVPNFNPRDVLDNMERMIRGDSPKHMRPWYKGFRGEILEISSQKYVANGEVSVLSEEKIEVTELPIGTWTQTYKENVIEPMATGTEKVTAVITDYKEYHTDVTVKFVIQMKPDSLSKFEMQGFHKVFKLQTNLNMSSMVLFDKNGCLKKYESVADILREFFELRLKMYSKRKDFLLGSLTAEASKLTNQARFILEKCDGKVTVENKKKKVMVEELFRAKYDSDPVKAWKARVSHQLQMDEEQVGEVDENAEAEEGKDYDYLLHLQILNLTLEKKEALLKERDNKLAELETLKRKSPSDLYLDDLKALRKMLDEVEAEEEESNKITKKKIIMKKGFNRKAEIAAGPSPMGQRVEPRIDELVKKFELADKAKENKGKGIKGGRKKLEMKAEPEDEEDEFDKMVCKNDSLLDVLNSSGDADEKKAGAKPKAKAPAKPRGEKGDGLKQSKLPFKKKEPAEKKKKKKSGSSGSESSDEELPDLDDDSDSDFDVGSKKSKKAAPKRSAAAIGMSDESDNDSFTAVLDAPPKERPEFSFDDLKAKLDTGDDDGSRDEPLVPSKSRNDDPYMIMSDESDDGAAARKPAPKKTAAAPPKKKPAAGSDSDDPFILSDSDSDFGGSKKKPAPKAAKKKEAPPKKKKVVSDDDDDEFDFAEKKKSKPAPASKKPTKKKVSSGSEDDDSDFGGKKKSKPAPKKTKQKAVGSGSDDDDFGLKLKSKPSKSAAPKKKKAVSDSDEELFDIDDSDMDTRGGGDGPARPRTQRAAAAAPKKWKDESDEDGFSDSN